MNTLRDDNYSGRHNGVFVDEGAKVDDAAGGASRGWGKMER